MVDTEGQLGRDSWGTVTQLSYGKFRGVHEMHVLIIDDQVLFAEAMAQALPELGLGSVDVVHGSAEAWRSMDRRPPDIVLLDVDRSDGDGVALGRAIVESRPRLKVVALASLDDSSLVREVMIAGFHGFVSKDTDPDRFLVALRSVIDGGSVFPEALIRSTPAEQPVERRWRMWRLTEREVEVLQLLSEGASGQEIAERLDLSPHTVRTHIQSIMSKLQVHSRLAAAALAVRHGLVKVPAP